MDIRQAYRNIPVHPSDRRLLGMRWKGKTFVNMALPFGLRSAPLIFSADADALAWMMQQQGVGWVAHYVDDFITVGAPDSGECARYVDIMHKVCEDTAMPVEPEKDEGPATTISFLGLELDSVASEVRLPQNKLQRLRSMLGSWLGRKACKKRELLSLIGSLTHACRAVRPGRSYLRRLINLSTSPRHLDQFIRLNREARADMEWWYLFISTWNGTSMMLTDQAGDPTITLTSDASGTWGCGAYTGEHWFMLPWTSNIQEVHIAVKELVPIVIAALMCGQEWKGLVVRARCDNSAVVAIVNSGSSRNPQAMHLRRCLAFLAAKGDFKLKAMHIRGVENVAADALSRNNCHLSRSCCPQGDRDGGISRHPRRGTIPGIRLAGEELDRAVAFYAGHALADSTKRSYYSAKRRYHTFCTHNHITPLPLNEHSLCRYVASLAREGLAHTSIKACLGYAISRWRKAGATPTLDACQN